MNTLFEIPVTQVTNEPYHGKVIYETKGRAREYRQLACNLYTGCDHGCKYCYAPDVLRRERPNFYSNVTPRKGILNKVRKDARGYVASGETRQVLFCFACDPYCKANDTYGLTRKAIEICHHAGLNVCILTKGGNRSLADLELLTPQDAYAVTLTTVTDEDSLQWEPGAAPYTERIKVLKAAHDQGIPTWVSLEPVIKPQWTLEIIRQTHEIVDEYKVGPLNYHPQADTVDWYQFASDVVKTLEKYDANYYLKRDLRKFIRN